MNNPVENVENFEHAMDALFASLHSSHLSLRELAAEQRERDSFRPRCGRCGAFSDPGTVYCGCGCLLVVPVRRRA